MVCGWLVILPAARHWHETEQGHSRSTLAPVNIGQHPGCQRVAAFNKLLVCHVPLYQGIQLLYRELPEIPFTEAKVISSD